MTNRPLPDGYTDLPPGKIATVVTYLEMTAPAPAAGARNPGFALARLRADSIDRYLTIFRTIGERWLWFSRLAMERATLAALLDHPDNEAFAVVADGGDVGLLELDFRAAPDAELAFFGLYDSVIGQGAGRWLMDEAVRRAFARPITRFFVHTCTLDHPRALEFYVRSGFRPYKRAIEVADDPRLKGKLPIAAAPHVPVL